MTDLSATSRSVVDVDAMRVRRDIRIDARIEQVWSAITEPEHVSAWFGAVALDGAGPGATGTITFPGHPPVPLRVEAVEPLRSITYRWNNDDAGGPPDRFDADRATVFTFTVEPDADGTLLSVVESGFEVTSDPRGNLEDHRKGWDGELDKLVARLERGA